MFKNYPELNYYKSKQISLPIDENKSIEHKFRKPRIKSAKKIIVKFGISKAICYDINNNKLNHKIIKSNNKDKTTYQKDFCSFYKEKHDKKKNKESLSNNKNNNYKNRFYDYLNIKQKNYNTNFDLKEKNNQNQYISTYSESYRKPIIYYDY